MKKSKVLRWASVLMLGIAISLAVFAPTQHALAASAAPIDDPGQDQTTCEQDSDPLDWILCPFFNAVSNVANYLYENIIIPFLKVPPVSTNPQDASFNVWSTFRIYGNIILVLAILIIVFGEVIGGGIIDAYTVKKVLPRILIAAVLINLSVYIVAALVDITNVIGNGIGDVIIAPFKNNALLNFKLSASQGVGIVFTSGFLGLLAIGGIGVAIAAMVVAPGAVAFLVLLLILPMVFAILAVFVTLIFRQGIILFLVMVSPIAFALYCLPNTERLFKRWWDFLLEALMVYPIVVIIFAVADVLAGTILTANNIDISTGTDNTPPNFVGHTLAAFTAFCLQFAPLFLVPFAFRMASGTLGRVHEFVTKGSAAAGGFLQKRTETQREKVGGVRSSAQREQTLKYRSLSGKQDYARFGRVKRAGAGFMAARLGGSNMEAASADQQALWNEKLGKMTNNERDAMSRGLTADLTDTSADNMKLDYDSRGNQVRFFKSLGGSWVAEADARKAQEEYHGNVYAQQASLAYEMRKAAQQGENDHLVAKYGKIVDEWGMSDSQAQDTWTGAAFANQNENLQYKYYQAKRDANGQMGLELNGLGLMREVDEKKGNYAMSLQNADTWTSMSQEVTKARQVMNGDIAGNRTDALETLERARRIAAQHAGRAGGGVPDPDNPGQMIGGQAPARVQQQIDAFVAMMATNESALGQNGDGTDANGNNIIPRPGNRPGDQLPEDALNRRGRRS